MYWHVWCNAYVCTFAVQGVSALTKLKTVWTSSLSAPLLRLALSGKINYFSQAHWEFLTNAHFDWFHSIEAELCVGITTIIATSDVNESIGFWVISQASLFLLLHKKTVRNSWNVRNPRSNEWKTISLQILWSKIRRQSNSIFMWFRSNDIFDQNQRRCRLAHKCVWIWTSGPYKFRQNWMQISYYGMPNPVP